MRVPKPPREYELALPLLFGGRRGLHGFKTTDRKYAAQYARDENKFCHEHSGRGVHIVPVDGNRLTYT